MSDFQSIRAKFEKKPQKKDNNVTNINQPGKISKGRTDIFEPKVQKKENPSKPPNNTIKSQKIEEYTSKFTSNPPNPTHKPAEDSKNQNNNKTENHIPSGDTTNSFAELIKKFNNPKDIKGTEQNKEEPKIIRNSQPIPNDNPNLKIYKYPDDYIDKNKLTNPKVLVFIGEHQEIFINAFINIYREINYEDEERYTIDSKDLNNKRKTYEIIERSKKYDDIKIISIPYSVENGELIRNILESCKFKIDGIFITLKNKNQLDDKAIFIFLSFLIIFQNQKNENIANIIKILYANNESNDLIKEKKDIAFNENLDISLDSLYKAQDFFINGNILYDKKSEDNKVQYDQLKEEIKKIQKNLNKKQGLNIDISIRKFLKDIFKNNKIENDDLEREFKKLDKRRQMLFINYYLYCNITYEISSSILFLYNLIINNKEEITIDNKQIDLTKDQNLNNALIVFSKVKFKNLNELICKKCELQDKSLYYIQNLFTQNLYTLNLSENCLNEMQVFNKEENLRNLKQLDLIHSNITTINYLASCNFENLRILNLSDNLISDISCLQNDLRFNKLEKLDLSINHIKKLNKINICTLKCLILTKNGISEGILDFLNNLLWSTDKLILEKRTNELFFQYFIDKGSSKSPLIELEYQIDDKNMNDLLKLIPLREIKYFEIDGFKDYEFLSNETLINLNTLTIKSKITDITIFNEIKFKNIKKIIFCNDESILKGFESLNIFPSIKVEYINIDPIKDNKIKCYITCQNPIFQHTFIFNDLNFLKEKFLENSRVILIDQEILDNENNWGLFSDNEIINAFPIFKHLKSKSVDIKFNNNKYLCLTDFNGYRFRIHFYVNDLNFLYDNIFNQIEELSLSYVILNDSIGSTEKIFETLKHLKILNFKTKINDITVFNEIKFENLKKIIFCEEELISKGFNALNIFPSIKVKSIKIEEIDNNYKCNLICQNPEFKCNFIFSDLLFLREKFFENSEEIYIDQKIINNENNKEFFSYNEIINSFPIFKNLKSKIVDIDYINNKYICSTILYRCNFRLNFPFDDLNFLNDNMFDEIEEFSLSDRISNDIIESTENQFDQLKCIKIFINF